MEANAELRFDQGDDRPERLKRQFSRLIGMTAAQVQKIAHEALSAVGAHKSHFVVLAALEQFGPASQARLSDHTGVYRSDMVAVLNELADGGYVERGPDPEDKRRNIITMTEVGAERLAELDRVLDDVNRRILGPFSDAERDQIFHLLGRLNAHLASG
ncbi:MarR family transcriptional regulator [Glycomyces sp. NPDC049804]|uniref:MarR family winged helix-turn-helix transcriptional regulator n=1 Tax=Glycomyces sp. NPDC049804 TaxID=3154363 RepID=UPI003428CE9F